MKTKHVNEIDAVGKIYCYKYNSLILFGSDYYFDKCNKCSYLVDASMADGSVTCEFDDGCTEGKITFDDSGDSEYHSKMQTVRLGMENKNDVIRKLKSMNDYSAELEPEEDEEKKDETTEDENAS